MADPIDANIAQLFEFANAALGNARSAEGRISSLTAKVSSANLNYTPERPNMSAPVRMSDILGVGNGEPTIRFLNDESDKWVDKYFPELNACLRSSPEEWLCGIITGQKPLGQSAAYFEAVWHEGRDREYRARNSAVRTLGVELSMRGFTLPTGAFVSAVSDAEARAADAIGEVNRTAMIKDADIKLDLLKFAEEQAIKLKLGVMQAMADFYRMWVEIPNREIEVARARTQAYASFQSSLAAYWNVQLGFEELRLQAANLRMNGKLDESRIRVSSLDGSRNAALGQAVQAYGSVAQGAANAASTLNANVSTS